jgi:hypothetical protein
MLKFDTKSIFSVTALLVTATLGNGVNAYYDDDSSSFDYSNASGIEALTSVGLVGTGIGVDGGINLINKGAVRTLHNQAQLLDDALIERLVKEVAETPLATFGFGKQSELGGALMTIEIDEAQFNRMSGASNAKAVLGQIAKENGMKVQLEAVSKDQADNALKLIIGEGSQGAEAVAAQMKFVNSVSPAYSTQKFNIRTIGSIGGAEGLRSQLNQYKDLNVMVKKITLKGMIAQGATKTIGAINIFVFTEAAVHGGKSMVNLIQHTTRDNNWMRNNCGTGWDEKVCDKNIDINAATPLFDAAKVYYYISRDDEPTSNKKEDSSAVVETE